jgi:NADPH:quinone reductase-like Zn-dependent oxidoreductase
LKRQTIGVDVILDNIGGSYFQKNLESLAIDGRLFIIGFMGGVKTEANISLLLAKRLTVQGMYAKLSFLDAHALCYIICIYSRLAGGLSRSSPFTLV